jgi:hypothetical protein
MSERRNVPEIVIGMLRIAPRIPNSDRSPLYDVINPAGASYSDNACEVMFSRTIVLAPSVRSPSSHELRRRSGHVGQLAEPRLAPPAKAGGARRDRTDDLMLAKHALSQLSYGPETRRRMLLTRAPSLTLRRSSLRSRRPAEPKLQSSEGWWAWEDLNFRPHAYQARAQTN